MGLSADDYFAIHQLYARYNHSIDFGTAEAWAACFTAEGSLDAGQGGDLTVGTEALVEFHTITRQFVPDIRHAVTNVLLNDDGDAVLGSAYLHVTGGTGAERNTLTVGIYQDVLVNENGEWRFAERVLIPD